LRGRRVERQAGEQRGGGNTPKQPSGHDSLPDFVSYIPPSRNIYSCAQEFLTLRNDKAGAGLRAPLESRIKFSQKGIFHAKELIRHQPFWKVSANLL
jgi:hypothetical protein